jgi:hypothetical protein
VGADTVIRCTRFRPRRKNTLQGFADLELPRVGIVIRDCSWHRHENLKEWVSFPARPYEDKSGKTTWSPLIEFVEGAREARDQFQRQALAAIHALVGEAVS